MELAGRWTNEKGQGLPNPCPSKNSDRVRVTPNESTATVLAKDDPNAVP